MSNVKNNQENLNKCICLNCPSFNDCAKNKNEALYCSKEIGKSACKLGMKGCICGSCPVHKENDLKTGYYCLWLKK